MTRIITLGLFLVCCAVNAQPYRLIFEGDSITEGVGTLFPDMGGAKTNIYGRWLTNYFWTCTNVVKWVDNGVSSSQIADLVNRYTNASLGNVQQYKPSGGTSAVLFAAVGVNNVTFSTPDTAEAIWQQYSNYLYRAKWIDGFTTVAFTCTSNVNYGATPKQLHVTFREILLTNYQTVADYLIDANTVLPNVNDTNQFVDGLHWSLEGHKMIATNVASIVDLCGSATPQWRKTFGVVTATSANIGTLRQ